MTDETSDPTRGRGHSRVKGLWPDGSPVIPVAVRAPFEEGQRIRLHVGDGKYVDATVGKVKERRPGWFDVQVDREPEPRPESPRHHLDRWVEGRPRAEVSLPDFLLARIAEDEEQANRSLAELASNPNLRIPASWVEGVAARVLAECKTKRQIVEMAWVHLGDDDYAWGMEEAKRQILAVLALPYAGHPDYREEWKP